MPFPAMAAETIIATLSEAVFLVSLNGEIQAVNQATLQLLEYQEEELPGVPFETIIGKNDSIHGYPGSMRETLEHNGVIKDIEVCLQTKPGTNIPVSLSVCMIRDPDGNPQGIVYIGKELIEHTHVAQHLLQLEKAVETMQIGVTITDLEGKIIYTNPAEAAMHGYRLEEVLGKDVGMFAPPEFRKPRTLERIKKWTGLIRESLNIRKDGSIFPVLLMSEIVKSPEAEPWAVVTSCEDITKRKQAEEALREAEAKFRSIFEHTVEGIFQSTPDGRPSSVNPALAKIHGYDSPEEFLASITNIGQQLYVNPDDRNVFRRMLEEKGRVINFETQVYHKDGSVIWVSISARTVFDQQGNVLFYEGTLIDITARKRTEEELKKHQEQLEELVKERTAELVTANTHLQQEISERKQAEEELKKAKEAADAANRAKSEFLTNMSHELRTPLNAILGYTQILKRDKDLTEKQHNAIRTIQHSSEHLLAMINELLDLSRIESRKMELESADVYLSGFLKGIVEIARIRAQQKGISFGCVMGHDLPIAVYADEKRLRQILLNLLNNAIKFTEQGKVIFTITNCEYRIANLENPKSEIRNPKSEISGIRFHIEDQGIGIPPDQLENIFQPFQQVGDRRVQSEGTGLGLTISQQLVRMMGAELFVTSTPGQGSSFWFDLRLPVVEDVIEGEAKPSRHIIGFKGEPRKILLVDDKDENRVVLKEMLSLSGFEIAEARDGREALAETTRFRPDLILMDMMMPGMDGDEATRRIRKLETDNWKPETGNRKPETGNSESDRPVFGFQLPVIIGISASAFETTRQMSLEAGCDDFLAKPIDFDELLEKLRVYLKLEWLYGEQPEAQIIEATSPQRPIVAPPAKELAVLHEWAVIGDIESIVARITAIETANSALTLFATQVRQFANAFLLDELEEFINQYMDDGEGT